MFPTNSLDNDIYSPKTITRLTWANFISFDLCVSKYCEEVLRFLSSACKYHCRKDDILSPAHLNALDTLEDRNVEKNEEQEREDTIDYKIGPHDVSKDIISVHSRIKKYNYQINLKYLSNLSQVGLIV